MEIHRDDGSVRLNFAEEVEKLARAPNAPWYERDPYRSTGRYKLKLERDAHGSAIKQWRGTASELEAQLPTIIQTVLTLPKAEGIRCRLLAEEFAEAKRRSEERERLRAIAAHAEQQRAAKQKAARDQVQRAGEVADALSQYGRIQDLLNQLSLAAAKDDNRGLLTWVEVVRSQISNPLDLLVQAIRSECDKQDQPLWWPSPLT